MDSYFLVDHLMIGSDFACHLVLIDLNFLVDSDYLVDHLMTGSNFACHLMVVG